MISGLASSVSALSSLCGNHGVLMRLAARSFPLCAALLWSVLAGGSRRVNILSGRVRG